jgi:hypothetical protein
MAALFCTALSARADAVQPPSDADDSWYVGYSGLQVLLEETGLRRAAGIEQALQTPSASAVFMLGSLQNLPRSDWLRLRRFVAQGGALLAAFEEPEFLRIPGVTTWFPGPLQTPDASLHYSGFEDVLQLPTEGSHPITQGVPSVVVNRSGWFVQIEDDSLQWSLAVRSPPESRPRGSTGGVVLAVGQDPAGSGGIFVLVADKSLYSDGMIWHGNNSILAINTVQQLAAGRQQWLIIQNGRLAGQSDSDPNQNRQMPEGPAPDRGSPPPFTPPPFIPPPFIRPPQFPPPPPPPPPSDLRTLLRTANAFLDKLQQSDLINRTLRDRPRAVRAGGWLRTMLVILLAIIGIWLLVFLCRRYLPPLPELPSRLMQSAFRVQTAQQVQQQEFGAAAEVLCRRFCVEVTGSHLETDWLRLRSGRQLPPTLASLPKSLKDGLEEIVGIAIHGCRISLPEWRFQELGRQLHQLLQLHHKVA